MKEFSLVFSVTVFIRTCKSEKKNLIRQLFILANCSETSFYFQFAPILFFLLNALCILKVFLFYVAYKYCVHRSKGNWNVCWFLVMKKKYVHKKVPIIYGYVQNIDCIIIDCHYPENKCINVIFMYLFLSFIFVFTQNIFCANIFDWLYSYYKNYHIFFFIWRHKNCVCKANRTLSKNYFLFLYKVFRPSNYYLREWKVN